MPPNKHDLGAKIQILNPNAPNFLLFKINIRFSNWQILGHFQSVTQNFGIIFELFLNYFFNSNEIFARIFKQLFQKPN